MYSFGGCALVGSHVYLAVDSLQEMLKAAGLLHPATPLLPANAWTLLLLFVSLGDF